MLNTLIKASLVAFIFTTFLAIHQRTNLFIFALSTDEPPALLTAQDEGDEAIWFDDYYTVHQIDERTYAIGESRYYQKNFNYLILGDTQAIVFDAGTGQRDIRGVVESLTTLPVTFVPSHLHYDHIGNQIPFASTALVDLPHLRARANNNTLLLERAEHLGEIEGYDLPTLKVDQWLAPNEIFDLGNRPLLVLYTPGHTDDSVSLLDQHAGYLFAGDFLYPGDLYGFLPNSNLGDYRQGANNVQRTHKAERLRIFGAHRDAALGLPELNQQTVSALLTTLDALRTHSLSGKGVYPVAYPVDERVTLLAEPRWFQRWEPRYPELAIPNP